MDNAFEKSFKEFVSSCHKIAKDHGFWNDKRNEKECLLLIFTEVAEAVESLREGIKRCEKIPEITNIEEELADICIRIFDMAGAFNYDLVKAIMLKSAYNKNRPVKHGKKF